MIDKPPQSFFGIDWNNFGLWFWSAVLCVLGGIVSFDQKRKEGHARPWNFAEFAGEMATCMLVGSITYKVCLWQACPPDLTPAIVGLTSHMGARALFKLEMIAEFLTNRRLGIPATPAPADTTKENDHG